MPRTPLASFIVASVAALAFAVPACSSTETTAPVADAATPVPACEIAEGAQTPDYVKRIGCETDFRALASEPLDITLPGARSVKTILDRADGDALYFQNSVKYKIHYDMASANLSGGARPVVTTLAQFNTTEYYSPDRRFVLGAVTYYEGPKIWALEIAPYDTASAAMITTLYRAIRDKAFFAGSLYFHPTSDAVAVTAKDLPPDVPIVTTDQIYAGIDYQPLTLATGVGRLRFVATADLEKTVVSYQDVLVLDQAPNDISVVQGLVTQEFQTPLSHVNVLSANRKTPNMGLRNAMANPALRALEGKLVELVVGASEWKVREVSQAEAEAFWNAHRPTPVTLPTPDLTVTGLVDIEAVTPEPAAGQSLRDAIKKAVLAFGGKAAHYSILRRTNDVPIQKAFAVPIYYYDQFMKQNGFYTRIASYLADPTFTSDATVRVARLAELRAAMEAAPVDEGLQSLLRAKIAAEYPNHKIRFRTSTNSEDLDGFPCAGCYESHSGNPANWEDVLDAIRETYASAWLFRTFEERTYYGVDHGTVGMALLVHNNFPDEEANGVAVTSNPFDPSGLDPALYVNVQAGGDVEVVAPPPGVTSDQFLHYFSSPNQPVTYLAHSSLVPAGQTVLTPTQVHALGVALTAIHARFSAAYGPASGRMGAYAMDVEFKFDDEASPGSPATLYVKQARPYPGRGQ